VYAFAPNGLRRPIRSDPPQDHPSRNAAILLLINQNNEVLLVRTRRLPNHWQPLGDGVDPEDLSARDAVVREVKEEAGIAISPEHMAHLCDSPYDFGTGTIHSFVAHIESDARLSLDETEITEAHWFTLADAVELPTFPALVYTLHCLASRPDLFY
jgi:8-oxo-dGTP pyrophosphatase MutT (NUDIX family)